MIFILIIFVVTLYSQFKDSRNTFQVFINYRLNNSYNGTNDSSADPGSLSNQSLFFYFIKIVIIGSDKTGIIAEVWFNKAHQVYYEPHLHCTIKFIERRRSRKVLSEFYTRDDRRREKEKGSNKNMYIYLYREGEREREKGQHELFHPDSTSIRSRVVLSIFSNWQTWQQFWKIDGPKAPS